MEELLTECRFASIKSNVASTFKLDLFSGPEQGYKCVDGYRTTGKIYIPSKFADYHQTRYIPYYDNLFSAPDPEYAQYPAKEDPKLLQSPVEDEFVQSAPHSWMLDLYQYYQYQINGETDLPKARHTLKRIDWMRNKRVLLMGDSVDRYLMLYICNEVGLPGEPEPLGRHVVAVCQIEFLNFTMFHWHIASMYTTHPKWWWRSSMATVPFEDRYEKLFKQTLPMVKGMNGVSPDLIIYQSGLWDHVTLIKYYQHLGDRDKLGKVDRQMTWQEIRFYISRTRKFIMHIRSLFGQDVPLMYRTQALRKTVDERDLFIEELDRAARFAAAKMSVEIFEWGKLVTGFSRFYKDDIHLSRGPMSWLWANMVFSYLFRVSGGIEFEGNITTWPSDREISIEDAWAECHAAYLDNSIR